MKLYYKIISIILIVVSIITIFMPKSFAARVKPTDITGQIADTSGGVDGEILTMLNRIMNILKFLGAFIAVGVLMVIGIKYITASTQEKANYKKSMVPYVVGCFLLFGASTIAPQILDIFKGTTEAKDLGNIILGIIRVVGTFIAVTVLMILGIKYMVGSAEEKASYKSTMIPYVIGSVLLFSAVNITSAIYNTIEPMNATYERYLSGKTTGEIIGKQYRDAGKSQEEFKDSYNLHKEDYDEAYEEDPNSETTWYRKGILEGMQEGYGLWLEETRRRRRILWKPCRKF